MAITVGNEAPDFTLKDQNGNDLTLSALRGRNVVIVFYPFTFTGVCQGELCEIRDDPSTFEHAGAQWSTAVSTARPCRPCWSKGEWRATSSPTAPAW